MDAIPTDTIDKLEDTWRSVIALGTGLSEEQWKLPTDLPGWTVQDNLSHLVAAERMLQGLPLSDHRSDPRDYVHNQIGEFNENEVDARRHLRGADVLAEWETLVADRLALLRSAGEDYFAQPANTPTGPGTMADFLHLRVLDCWLHEQDMRRAVGIPGHASGPAAEHTIDRLLRGLPMVVGKRAGTPDGSAVELRITGGVERDAVAEMRNGRGVLVDQPIASPLVSITCDAEAYVVVATGRRSYQELAGRFAIDGDVELGERVLHHLNTMI